MICSTMLLMKTNRTMTNHLRWLSSIPLRTVALISIVIVAAVGTALFITSQAASPVTSVEAEAGTRTGNATTFSESNASGGSAVKFNATAAFQANCINTPSACGYPDATNTGIPAGTVLTTSDCITVTTNGAVVQNLHITDCNITIHANNVTIKNTLIDGCTYFPIDYPDGGPYTGLVVQDTEIAGNCSQVTAGLSFAGYTAIRVHVHGTADGFKANSNTVIRDSYIHDLAVTASSHNDGIQSTGGSNVTFQHNTCDLRSGGDDCFQPGPSDSGWLYTDNLLGANSNVCWMINGNTGTVNSTFTNNRFMRIPGGGCSNGSSPASLPGTGNTWSGNIWDDNGAPATL